MNYIVNKFSYTLDFQHVMGDNVKALDQKSIFTSSRNLCTSLDVTSLGTFLASCNIESQLVVERIQNVHSSIQEFEMHIGDMDSASAPLSTICSKFTREYTNRFRILYIYLQPRACGLPKFW